MANMPKQKPGRSEQVVETPDIFLSAVKARLGIKEFIWDLAASKENTKATNYFTEEDNSLIQNWPKGEGWSWCNPPYGDIEPWVWWACHEAESGSKVAMLVPASVGSNWWSEYVHTECYVTLLNGRITFVGHKGPYPKDLALLLYAPYLDGGSCVWRWKE